MLVMLSKTLWPSQHKAVTRYSSPIMNVAGHLDLQFNSIPRLALAVYLYKHAATSDRAASLDFLL